MKYFCPQNKRPKSITQDGATECSDAEVSHNKFLEMCIWRGWDLIGKE